MITYTCQIYSLSAQSRYASPAESSAIAASAKNMTRRRFQRSTKAPVIGPNSTWGSIATSDAMASTVAEPEAWVSHHTRAKLPTWLPTSESAYPVQRVKNGLAQFGLISARSLDMVI